MAHPETPRERLARERANAAEIARENEQAHRAVAQAHSWAAERATLEGTIAAEVDRRGYASDGLRESVTVAYNDERAALRCGPDARFQSGQTVVTAMRVILRKSPNDWDYDGMEAAGQTYKFDFWDHGYAHISRTMTDTMPEVTVGYYVAAGAIAYPGEHARQCATG